MLFIQGTSSNKDSIYRRWVGIDYYNTFVGGDVTEDQMLKPLDGKAIILSAISAL